MVNGWENAPGGGGGGAKGNTLSILLGGKRKKEKKKCADERVGGHAAGRMGRGKNKGKKKRELVPIRKEKKKAF